LGNLGKKPREKNRRHKYIVSSAYYHVLPTLPLRKKEKRKKEKREIFSYPRNAVKQTKSNYIPNSTIPKHKKERITIEKREKPYQY